jgi:hypothetical protein
MKRPNAAISTTGTQFASHASDVLDMIHKTPAATAVAIPDPNIKVEKQSVNILLATFVLSPPFHIKKANAHGIKTV